MFENRGISFPNDVMRDLDTSLLRTFVAVAERGSMTAGAVALSLTQGAVSQKIARLEDQAGGLLLTRDRRGLGLTPMGERLLGKARRMLALNDEIWTDMRGGSIDGPVRLGLPVDLAGPLLVPMLKEFMAAFPRVEPHLRCGSSSEIRKRLDGGELDLALLEEPASDVTGECLGIDRLVWAGAPGGVAYLREPLPVALASDTCCFRSHVLAALARADRNAQTLFGNGGLDAAVAVVRADIAVSVWLESSVPAGLDVLSQEAALPELPAYATTLHRPARATSPAVDELARYVRKEFSRLHPAGAARGHLAGVP